MGKRGGVRIIYYYKKESFTFLFSIYAKSEKEDLNNEELRLLKQRLEDFK